MQLPVLPLPVLPNSLILSLKMEIIALWSQKNVKELISHLNVGSSKSMFFFYDWGLIVELNPYHMIAIEREFFDVYSVDCSINVKINVTDLISTLKKYSWFVFSMPQVQSRICFSSVINEDAELNSFTLKIQDVPSDFLAQMLSSFTGQGMAEQTVSLSLHLLIPIQQIPESRYKEYVTVLKLKLPMVLFSQLGEIPKTEIAERSDLTNKTLEIVESTCRNRIGQEIISYLAPEAGGWLPPKNPSGGWYALDFEDEGSTTWAFDWYVFHLELILVWAPEICEMKRSKLHRHQLAKS